MPKRRGKNAARSGKSGEDIVETMMSLAGFPVVTFKNYDGSTPMCVKQFPVPHPYRPEHDRAGANDFMLFSGEVAAYCQVKNQNSPGTCDEKLAFAFDIARYAVNDKPFDVFALILLGTWWVDNPSIVDWARNTKCKEFESLSRGTRRDVSSVVIVGHLELRDWLLSLPKSTKNSVASSTNKLQHRLFE